LVWLGGISYGLYLWHWPIFFIMTRVYHCKGWTVVLVGSPLALALVVTMLSYYQLEKPILALKRRFTPLLRTTAPNPVITAPRGLSQRQPPLAP
jgi:peptidoglycan/LPS O-acetylase OafA/YrhL